MSRKVNRTSRVLVGSVYVVTAPNGYLKVGTSQLPFERFSMMQTSSPLLLTLAYVCECEHPVEIEIMVHAALETHRRHGEWFEVEAAVAIEALRSALGAFDQKPRSLPQLRDRQPRGTRAIIQAQVRETTLPSA